MKVTITMRHVELTADMKAHAEERIGKIAHFSGSLSEIAVVLSSERHVYQAEMTTRSDGLDLASHAEHQDLRAAIDAAAAKLERQVKDQHARMQEHKPKPDPSPAVTSVEPPA